MKFGKSLSNQIEQTLPEWRHKFLSYKELKKSLKLINPQRKSGDVCNREAKRPKLSGGGAGDWTVVDGGIGGMSVEEVGFVDLLEKEIEKFNLFFLEKEEEYIIKLKLLFLVGLGTQIQHMLRPFNQRFLSSHASIAIILGVETVNVLKTEGQAKVGGTLVCIFGAILMVLFKGPALLGYADFVPRRHHEINAVGQPELSGWTLSGQATLEIDKWHIGVLCLVGNCMCMAAFLAIQAPLLAKYPANLSVTAFSYFFGTLFMVMTAIFTSNGSTNWHLTHSDIWAVVYAGIVTSALNYGLMTWSNKILGPSLVALYNPLQPAATSFLSRIFLGSAIYLGSVVGGLLIIAGLYLVTWATYREKQQAASGVGHSRESEPLIGQIFYGPSPTVAKNFD